jgi:hypothetical protein
MTDPIEAMAAAYTDEIHSPGASHYKAIAAAIAALSETHVVVPKDRLVPVGWMYHKELSPTLMQHSFQEVRQPERVEDGWTETPLYTLEGIKL